MIWRATHHPSRAAAAAVGPASPHCTGASRPPLHAPRRRHARAAAAAAAGEPPPPDPDADAARGAAEKLLELDPNVLHTLLDRAVAAEDYATAARLRDVMALAALAQARGDGGGGEAGAPPPAPPPPADWRALGVLGWLADRAERMGFRAPTEVQRRAAPHLAAGADAVVSSQTGSGKTLAFLLPLLSRLKYPPEKYLDDLDGPPLVVVVPTRELGVQTAMLAFKLLGGSVNPGVPGERSNIFAFGGPKGLRVRGLLLDDEVEAAAAGSLRGAHVLVGTPPLLAAAAAAGAPALSAAEAVAVDEVDACFEEFPDAMAAVLAGLHAGGRRPQVALVGATVGDAVADAAAAAGWVRDPVRVAVGAAGGAPRVPAGLRHRAVVVPAGGSRALALARLLRADLAAAGPDAPPPRAMVFAGSEPAARALAAPLRAALWGEHALAVLLPGGDAPIRALHAFRDNRSTLLLATPAAARGLDLPAVSAVYSLEPPATWEDYLHRAGRAGRLGAAAPGAVTTLVAPGELPALRALAEAAGVALAVEDAPAPPAGAERGGGEGGEDGGGGGEGGAVPEDVRKALEDLFNLG